jgi:hypothetical protein
MKLEKSPLIDILKNLIEKLELSSTEIVAANFDGFGYGGLREEFSFEMKIRIREAKEGRDEERQRPNLTPDMARELLLRIEKDYNPALLGTIRQVLNAIINAGGK